MTIEKRIKLRQLLTDRETMDLGDMELADFAGVTLAEAREYRIEFDRLMEWAFTEIIVSGAAVKLWARK